MGRDNFLTIVQLLTPNGQSMIDDDADALRVTFPSTASLAVKQVSGAADSVNIVQQDVALETRQVSGTVSSMNIVQQDVTLQVQQLSGATDSVKVTSFDTSLDVKQVSGGIDSTEVSAIAMTTNPTSVADGASVKVKTDKLGRLVTTPIQVRDLRATARASLTNGTEATLLAGAAGVFHDLVEIKLANLSTVAATVYLRDATGGGIIDTFRVPADSSIGFSLATPKPQSVAADTWTVDMEDITGTTVDVDALFVKNT